MKTAIAILFALVAVGAFAEWSGAAMWADYDDKNGQRIATAGDFMEGYFMAVESVTMLSERDRSSLGLIGLQIDASQLRSAVNQFYSDTRNSEPSIGFALKICLETLISRTKDGPRLLNVIYERVGGWKPFTTWEAYNAGR